MHLEPECSPSRLRRAERLTDEDWAAITPAIGALAERELWIDDTALPNLAHIRAEAMTLKARQGLGLVMVDYVQLVQGRGKNRYEELRDVSYGLKALAKDLAVPVIVLAQLNRGVETATRSAPTSQTSATPAQSRKPRTSLGCSTPRATTIRSSVCPM